MMKLVLNMLADFKQIHWVGHGTVYLEFIKKLCGLHLDCLAGIQLSRSRK